MKTRNTAQYRKCVFRSSWSPEVKTRNTVQYRKCVFQIVLESGSDDSQPCLIRIQRINFDADPDPDFYLMRIQVTIMMRILVYPDPQHCSIPEVRISDCPGDRK